MHWAHAFCNELYLTVKPMLEKSILYDICVIVCLVYFNICLVYFTGGWWAERLVRRTRHLHGLVLKFSTVQSPGLASISRQPFMGSYFKQYISHKTALSGPSQSASNVIDSCVWVYFDRFDLFAFDVLLFMLKIPFKGLHSTVIKTYFYMR